MIFNHRIERQRGAMMIAVAVAVLVVFAFLVLAVDVPMMMLTKGQLQNAADAAALSAALAYGYSEGDHALATDAAIELAGMNMAVQDIRRPVTIGTDDVTFPELNVVRVLTHRAASTGDALVLNFLRVVNTASDNRSDVKAVASARIAAISGTDCIKPWIIPDRWDDDGDDVYESAEPLNDLNGNGVWDEGETFDDENNNMIWDPGEYYDPLITGYDIPRDVGDTIVLNLSNPNDTQFRTGWFYAVDFAPINSGLPVETGGDPYREWIYTCEPYVVSIGDSLQIEPGRMVGPTAQGVADLIALDPNAIWDNETGTIINSAYPTSPRVIKAAAFSPEVGINNDGNGRSFLTVVKIVAVFLENYRPGGEVLGRFIRQATVGVPCPECPPGFMFTVYLIE